MKIDIIITRKCLFMNKTEEFMKNIEVKKGLLITAIVILLASLAFELLAFVNMKNTTKEAVPFLEAKDTNVYSYIDVELMTDCFAKYTEGNNTLEEVHFVFDENYIYIASINNKYEKELKDIYEYTYDEDENAKKPESVRIYGYTTSIPTELKNLAVESYNDFFGTDLMTSSNFYDVMGMYYLNTEKSPSEDFLWQSIIIGMFAIVGIVLLLRHNKMVKITKNTLNNYATRIENIKMDINDANTIYYKAAKIYLMKDYLINFANGFELYEYKDIVWIYPHELRQNGFLTQKSIYVVTNDAKVHIIANLGTSKKNMAIFNELYENLHLRIPNALYGYTKENKEKSKTLYTNKK